jgi:hypothetical protein
MTADGSELGIDATKKLPKASNALATAHQDGCCGEEEGGKNFQSVKADVRRLKLNHERRSLNADSRLPRGPALPL